MRASLDCLGRLILTAAALLLLGAAHAGAETLDFRITSIDGDVLDSSKLRGSPMVISIMATWCRPCKDEAAYFERAYHKYKERGVLVFAVFVGSRENHIRDFAENYGMTFPVARDNSIAQQVGARAVPATVFVGRDGTIKKKHLGPVEYHQIEAGIEEILR